MAFTLPDFNLTCNIWHNATLWQTTSPDLSPICNLAYSRRTNRVSEFALAANEAGSLISLLLPAGTDVRDLKCQSSEDLVEVPAGSGRIYRVCDVDDIGKGFSNEHRCAIIIGVSSLKEPGFVPGAYFWPTPIP